MKQLKFAIFAVFLTSYLGGFALCQRTDCEVEQQTLVQVYAVREGYDIVYTCQPPTRNIDLLDWVVCDVNNQKVRDDSISEVISGGYSTLTFPAETRFNGSILKCLVYFETSSSPITVTTYRVLLQGLQDSVKSLDFEASIHFVNISWTAPFSLNLTTAEPDIQYCVDVYNVTGGGDLVESRCDITETFYTYTPDNPSPDHVFNFTVTPRSNVEGALNGTTSEPVQGGLCRKPSSIVSQLIGFRSNIYLDPMTFTFPAVGGPDMCVPLMYTVELKPLQAINDISQQPTVISCIAKPTTTDNTTELTFNNLNCSSDIVRHELYNVTIKMAYNGGVAESDGEKVISTHDVQSPEAHNCSQPGQINITSTYLDETKDLGFFVLAYPLDGFVNFTYRAAVRNVSKPNDHSICLSTGLQDGTYMIAVYDLEHEAMPNSMPADVPRSVDVVNNGGPTLSNNGGEPNKQSEVDVSSTSNGMICISCSFSDPSTTGCVGIIHSADIVEPHMQQITLSSLLIERNNNNILNNGSCTEHSVTVSGNYAVAVFNRKKRGLEKIPVYSTVTFVEFTTTEPDSSTPSTTHPELSSDAVIGAIIGTLFAVLLFVVVTIVIVVSVSLKCIPKKKINEQHQVCSYPSINRYVENPPDFEPDLHYETVPLPARPPAYEKIDLSNDTNQQTSIPIDKDAPPLPPPCKPEDIILPSQVELIQHDTDATTSAVTPVEESQPESHDSHMEGFVVPEPAYDVAKIVMVKQATSSGPLVDSTATEHEYSEIKGAKNKDGLHYAHVTPKPKPEGLPDQPVDPTAVIYSQVVKDKVVREAKDSKKVHQKESVPPPLPPSAESLLSIIHPISDKWEELGKALGIDEDRVDVFSNEEHDKVRLHDMVHHYFGNVHVKHTWEEFVVALKKIGEYEYADKIVREKKLEDVYLSPDSAPVPPVPPRGCTSTQIAEPDFENVSVVVGPLTSCFDC